jgi:hypothetical protein
MWMNLFYFVPYFLLEDRFKGAVMAMILGGAIGSLMAYLFSVAIRKFPEKGLPEIFREFLPAWIWKPVLFYFVLFWFSLGVSVTNTNAIIIARFFNPNIKLTFLIIFFVLICIWAATRPTRTILYGQEIVILLILPAVMFILAKACGNKMLDWDAIRTVANYVGHLPSLTALSSASIVLMGYLNFSIFNRNFKKDEKFRYRWILPIMGYLTLVTTFFIPIGFHGTVGVVDYIHVWISTADSMRMKYGFFERLVFLFIIVYLLLSLVFVSVVWHVGAETFKGCFASTKPNLDRVETPVWSWCICGIFGLLTVVYQKVAKEKMEIAIAGYLENIRFWSGIGLLVLLFIVVGRKRKKGKA